MFGVSQTPKLHESVVAWLNIVNMTHGQWTKIGQHILVGRSMDIYKQQHTKPPNIKTVKMSKDQ